MDSDRDDPVLDACLDEVLAGRTPPDLTGRILARASRPDASKAKIPPVLASLPGAFGPASAEPSVAVRTRSRSRENSPAARTIGLAAGVIGLGLAIGITWLVIGNRSPIAQRPDEAPTEVIAKLDSLPQLPPAPAPEGPKSLDPAEPSTAIAALPEQTSAPASSISPPPPAAGNTPASSVAAAFPQKRYPPPSPDSQIVSFVNTELARVWNEAGVKPTPAIADAEWSQRLFTRVLGRAPTAEELKGLADDKSALRREKLVERLLTHESYAAEFANHWSATLTNVLLGKRSQPVMREELQKHLQTALTTNTAYDAIVRDLLTATGTAQPGADDYNPAVSFLLAGLTADAAVATARVSRVLLGHQLQCAQCHQHPTQDWPQQQFWALNAFFRQMRAEQTEGGPRLISTQISRDVFYETPDGLTKTAQPQFIDGAIIAAPDGATIDRRRELARMLTQSDDFAKATVNRIWAQVFDYGFTRPVDDLGPNTSATAPLVFDHLATQFAAHGFDLKRLIRWTVLSEPFNRSSKITDLASKDMPEEGQPALFSRYYARPVQLPTAGGALVQAARIRRAGGSASDVQKARVDWLTQANRAPAKASGKAGAKAPPISSSVLATGGDLAHRSVSGDPTGLVKKLSASSLAFDQKVDHLFLAALARRPSNAERRTADDLLRAAQDNQTAALEDTWWALINSSDCVLDR